jgi:hypothetical protein
VWGIKLLREKKLWVLAVMIYAAVVLQACHRDKDDNFTSEQIHPPLGIVYSIPAGDVSFFELRPMKLIQRQRIENWSILATKVNPGSNRLVLANGWQNQNRIMVVQLPELETIASESVNGMQTDVDTDEFSSLIYLITRNGYFWRYDISEQDFDTLDIPYGPRRMSLRPPRRNEVWIACPADQSIQRVDLIRFEKLTPIPCTQAPTDIQFSGDGQLAYVGFSGVPGKLAVYDATSLEETHSVMIGRGPFDISISDNLRYLAASDSTLGTVHFWDLEADTSWTIPVGGRAGYVQFAHRTTDCYVYSITANHIIRIPIRDELPAIPETLAVPDEISNMTLWENP